MRRFFVVGFLFLMPVLSAYTEPCPGQFGLSFEWLYMLSSYDQPYFVIDSSTSADPRGRRVANDQEWHSGYRIEGIYASCNCFNDIRVRWTHFPTFSDEKGTSGPNLWSIINSPQADFNGLAGTISIEDTFDFYFLEVLFGQKVFFCGPFQMQLQGGLQYGYLDLREDVFFDPVSVAQDPVTVKAHSQLWGIGPEIGYEFSYCLWDCLTLTGRGNATLLISKRKASYQDMDPNPEIVSDNDPYWVVIPTTDLRFGLSYARIFDLSPVPWLRCFCRCLNVDFEVGYEVITYYRGLDRTKYYDDTSLGLSADQLMDFTVHGPYVHLGLIF